MGAGAALYRGSEELVGPLAGRSSFSYVMDNGSMRTNVAAADLDRIRVVRLNAVAIDDDARFDIERTLTFDIPLRN